MAVYEFTPEQIAEIESARKTATNRKAVKHLEILSLYAHGMSVKQITEKQGFVLLSYVSWFMDTKNEGWRYYQRIYM